MMKKLLSILCVVIMLFSLSACNDKPKTNLPTKDLKDMIVGAELPYLLYANNDYCIINIWHGGVVVYDFTTQKLSHRVTFEKLEEIGFSYPIPMASENGKMIYFSEDKQSSKQHYTYSYNIETKELCAENENIKNLFHYESIFENQMTQALLLSDFAYGNTMIILDDTFIVTRLSKNGSMLSDMEIVLLDKNLEPVKTFPIYENK